MERDTRDPEISGSSKSGIAVAVAVGADVVVGVAVSVALGTTKVGVSTGWLPITQPTTSNMSAGSSKNRCMELGFMFMPLRTAGRVPPSTIITDMWSARYSWWLYKA